MKRSTILIFLLLLAAITLPVTISARRLAAAEQRATAAADVLLRTAREAREVMQLRAERQRIAAAEQPANDVVARLTDTLTAAGLPRRFQALTPDPVVPLNPAAEGVRYARQSFSVALLPMTVEQLGRFLNAWRERQSLWTVTRIDLTHESGPAAATSQRYDVSIVISAVYVAD